jgi:hypothetical protein
MKGTQFEKLSPFSRTCEKLWKISFSITGRAEKKVWTPEVSEAKKKFSLLDKNF